MNGFTGRAVLCHTHFHIRKYKEMRGLTVGLDEEVHGHAVLFLKNIFLNLIKPFVSNKTRLYFSQQHRPGTMEYSLLPDKTNLCKKF